MLDRLRKVLATVLDIDVAAVTDDASPATVKNWDSLKQMQIMLALEDEFHVHFDDEQILELSSFQKLLLELQRRVNP